MVKMLMLYMLFVIILLPFVRRIVLKRRRMDEVSRELPYVLDLLSLSVEAGLDFISAIDRIVRTGRKTVITDELRTLLDEIRLGKSRLDAIRAFGERLDHPAVRSFVGTLVQADRLGVPISKILMSHSEKLRSERLCRVERLGVKASQKLLFPLVFCIMPAVFVVIFGPLVVMWKNGTFERIFS